MNKRKVLTFLAIIDRHNHWGVLFILLGQLVLPECRELEVDHAEYDLLLHTRRQIHRLHKVVLIRRIKHDWHVVLVLLLSHAAAYPNIAIYFCINLEGQL